MKAHEIMRNVECIDPDTFISKAAAKMRELDIGFLPICENDKLVGTITDRDIAIRCVPPLIDPRLIGVREIMTPAAFYCFEADDIEKVAQAMQEKAVRRMLIVDVEEKLVGVITVGDLARAAGESNLAGETLGRIVKAA
jgi:CBS domain-containing protein